MTEAEIVYHPLIIPTVVIPFALLLTGLSALATFIAGLFGLRLKAEGPKKLLEVLLKPRILLFALLSNLLIIGGVKGYQYWKNAPLMLWRIEKKQTEIAKPSSQIYPDSSPEGPLQTSPKLISNQGTGQGTGRVETVWVRDLGSGSFRGATLSGDSAFVGTSDGYVHEIDHKSGELRRSFFIGTPITAAVRIYSGSLYASEGRHDTHHARLYKFSLSTGLLEATYTSGGHIEGDSIAAKGDGVDVMLVPSGKDGLAAVDSRTLTRVWHAKDGHIDAAVRVVNGRVFSGSGMEKENPGGAKGMAFSYELATGRKVWQRELPSSSWMRSIAHNERICFVFGEVYFASDLGGFYCFRQSDGQPDIAYNNAAPIAAEPVFIEDDLLISDFRGKVCRVSLETGRALWCHETGEARAGFANASFDSERGVVIYPSEKNGLFVLNPQTGEVIAQWKAEGESQPWSKNYAPAAVLSDGWIVVDMKGVMRKLKWTGEARTEKSIRQSARL